MQDISISSSQMKIDDLEVRNPAKAKKRTAFKAKKIEANFSLQELRGKRSVVDSILVDKVYLNVICFDALCSSNNWTEIMKGISSTEEKHSKKQFLIKKLIIKDLTVDIHGIGGLIFPSNKKKTITISYLEFDNITSESGFPTQELFIEIFKRVGIQEYLKSFIQDQGKMLKSLIPPFKF